MDKFDEVSFFLAYEDGELSDEDIIEGFQHIISNGLVWSLQGSYGQTAAALIDAGICHR